jgi:hypothetical protein
MYDVIISFVQVLSSFHFHVSPPDAVHELEKDAWTERPRRTNSSLLCTSRIIRWLLLPSANPIQWRTTIYDFHLFSSSWENNLQSSVMCRHVWSHRINRWESHDWIYVVPPSDSGVISAHPQLGADRSWSERNPGQLQGVVIPSHTSWIHFRPFRPQLRVINSDKPLINHHNSMI